MTGPAVAAAPGVLVTEAPDTEDEALPDPDAVVVVASLVDSAELELRSYYEHGQ